MCCQILADYYRYLDMHDQELQYTLEMKRFSARKLDTIKNIVITDFVRNAEFRLGYSTYFGLTIEERIAHLKKAFGLAVDEHHTQHSEMTERIVSLCTAELFKVRYQYVTAIQKTDSEYYCQTITEQCMQIIEEMFPWLELLYESDDSGEVNELMKQLVSLIAEAAYIHKDRAIDMMSQKLFNRACFHVSLAVKLLKPLNELLQQDAWITEMIRICDLAVVCFNNRRVCFDGAQSIDDELYYIHWIFTMILEYQGQFGFDQTVESKWKKYINHFGGWYSMMYAWLHFAADMLSDPEKEQVFWKSIEAKKYDIPGQRSTWLFFLEKNAYSDKFHGYLQIVGEWLCSHLNTNKVNKLLYLCPLFEETALYYAYRHAMFDKADIIIQNGYDYYLELSTLYLIYSYDRSSYRKYMYELKYICLKRLIEKIKYFQSAHCISSYFLSETQNICKGILKQRDVSNYNDPKNDSKRHVLSL